MNAFRTNRKCLHWFSVLILIAFLLWGSSPVQAVKGKVQETKTEVYTLEDFDYLTDQNFQGVQVDRTFNFALPEDWMIEAEATLSIRFSHSPALNPFSSMNVRWNGNAVGSTRLTKENSQNGLLEITLPPEGINAGFNTLQIEFFMGIAENFCIDFDNPSVWAVVHNDSSIQLTYQQQARESELELAPRILIDSSLVADNQITLIIPAAPELEIIQALARLAAKLGRMAEWRNTDISVMTMEEAIISEPIGDLIVIGTLEQINASLRNFNDQITAILNKPPLSQTPFTPDDGLIFFQPSPFDPSSKVLGLTGESLSAVEKSVLAAILDQFYQGATGAWSIVRSVPDLPAFPGSGDLSISMSDLGIDDQSAFGTREQTIQFTLPLSALWEVNTEARLELHFAHSQLLNSDRSTLSIILNEIPVASIPLTSETANEGFEEIRIPLRYFEIGDNTITFRANLEHRDTREDYRDFCTDETYPRAWITIHSNTAFVLPEKPEETSLNLSNFPFGFADVFSYEDFSFILGSEFDNGALKAMVDVAVSMGKALRGHPAGISVQTPEQLGDAHRIKYHIMIGASQDLIVESLNDRLPIPLDLETGLLQPNQTALEIDTPSGLQGIIQAFQEGQEDVFLLLTGQTSEALIAGGNLLAEPELRTILDGNLAVFNAPEQAMSYRVTPEQDAPERRATPQPDGEQPLRLNGQSVWIVRISIGLAVLSVIILVIALIWKNRNAGES